MVAGLAAVTMATPASPASAQRCDDVASAPMPVLVGLTEAQARARLDSIGVRVRSVSLVAAERGQAGSVVGQVPQVGRCVTRTTRVEITVAGTREVRVPDVVGSNQIAAAVRLMVDRLSSEIVNADSDQPSGEVIRQEPAAGTTATEATVVRLVVSRGPRRVRMPDLTGVTLERARAILSELRLRLAAVDSAESDAAAGTVVRQRPAPRTEVEPGAAVAVTLARAQPPPVRARVPRLLGLTHEQAAVALERAGLPMGVVGTAESDLAPGTVVAQTLAPETEVAPGTAVGISLATVVTVAVPDVTGGPLANAAATLERFGLAPGAVEPVDGGDAAANTVTRQSPAAGTRVALGTPVRLQVAREAVAPPVVPDLIDLTREAAEAALAQAGLATGLVGRSESDAPEGTVVAQSPPAGTPVAAGAQVSFSIAAPPLTVVPHVIGTPDSTALRTLSAAGLVFTGELERVHDPAAPATVVGQRPAAGERVAPGSSFGLVLSLGPANAVPDVVGLPLERALETLEAAGYRARVDSVGVDSARADSAALVVIAQSPAGGTDAPPGTLVALTVGPGPTLPWVVVVLLLILGAAAAAWRRGREILQRVFGRGAPVVTTSGAWDPGGTKVSVAGKLVSGPPVTFSAGGDPGVQTIDVDGELITAEVER